ncbi:glutamine--fructose-6-phosphate transaminase [Magnetococcus marinus MC-1]|uniref:Glutamine--fructose-6-phosphate aminotransferase [isomerizing] n=1 Tax=Magnetococcus marinus (strain ATCC BAA-1437 / JCM 17883 / MC-1) TaxID=156889 RepID=A0LD97_MAGMM|nr:glutamine--fructose-6-phosphate transaminase (isomerizing) [Magnetococcus marinus]ABK45940.1 glutamine--fructose-6-phosphate transaminase [Magnetococcus marinus MC-1]
MCGIIGVIGERNATPILIEGLRRLEYRGYDSAGIAVAYQGKLLLARAEGKLVNLENELAHTPRTGFLGIGHTRWATHGPPTIHNAHPHRSESVAVVHNGIIENYQELREELMAHGVTFVSETDTEVIPHLIEMAMRADPHAPAEEAVRRAICKLQGAFALGILIQGKEDMLIAARRGSPLIIGLGDGENFIGSDATPLVPYTRRMIYLHDDDMAVLTKDAVRLMDMEGAAVSRPIKVTQVRDDVTEKWPYRHYMQKEIYEQPTAIGETLKELIHPAYRTISIRQNSAGLDLATIEDITIVACGTSWHAGLVAKYWIEQLAHVPVQVDIASEYRYRASPMRKNGLMIVISQSGETADTLAAMRYAKQGGLQVLGVVNVPESSIDREADATLHTYAGPEIGVASTKAFTTQLTALACFALAMAKAKGVLDAKQEQGYVDELLQLPAKVEQVLIHDASLEAIARELMHANGFLFLGRGTCFPIALEGALKLKEISYIHAEGYAAGEMKHGPIALIDEDLPVVVVAPQNSLFDKVVSNVEEVKARGGRVLMITTQGQAAGRIPADYTIPVVPCGEFVAPILYVIPLQMLAYHIAVLKGTDVDQPRNLAKSVTVE